MVGGDEEGDVEADDDDADDPDEDDDDAVAFAFAFMLERGAARVYRVVSGMSVRPWRARSNSRRHMNTPQRRRVWRGRWV